MVHQDSVLVGDPSIRTVIGSGQETRGTSKTNLESVVSQKVTLKPGHIVIPDLLPKAENVRTVATV
jgi:hypothetical protein